MEEPNIVRCSTSPTMQLLGIFSFLVIICSLIATGLYFFPQTDKLGPVGELLAAIIGIAATGSAAYVAISLATIANETLAGQERREEYRDRQDSINHYAGRLEEGLGPIMGAAIAVNRIFGASLLWAEKLDAISDAPSIKEQKSLTLAIRKHFYSMDESLDDLVENLYAIVSNTYASLLWTERNTSRTDMKPNPFFIPSVYEDLTSVSSELSLRRITFKFLSESATFKDAVAMQNFWNWLRSDRAAIKEILFCGAEIGLSAGQNVGVCYLAGLVERIVEIDPRKTLEQITPVAHRDLLDEVVRLSAWGAWNNRTGSMPTAIGGKVKALRKTYDTKPMILWLPPSVEAAVAGLLVEW